jgi:hypothetical protein
MNIIFDLDQLAPGWDKHLPVDEMVAVDDIYEYVETRVKVLKDEIESEENKESGESCIVIAFTKDKIMFMGYSDNLTEKLKSCFDENDITYLQKKLNDTSKNFLS